MRASFLLILLLSLPLIASAQTVIETPQRVGVPDPLASGGTLTTPAMRSEDLLRIRNLQYEQDKRLIELLKLEARYKEVQQQIAQADQHIEIAIRVGAKTVNVDVDKDYIFDLDTLKFVPRPQPVKPTEPVKPPEVKPNAKH